jgi:hypothetical protein
MAEASMRVLSSGLVTMRDERRARAAASRLIMLKRV